MQVWAFFQSNPNLKTQWVLKVCSKTIFDNLLVRAEVFIILGVSICVTLSAFNFIGGWKQGHKNSIQKAFFSPFYIFFIEILAPFSFQIVFNCSGFVVILKDADETLIYPKIISSINLFN